MAGALQKALALTAAAAKQPRYTRIAYLDFVPKYPQCSHSTYVAFPA